MLPGAPEAIDAPTDLIVPRSRETVFDAAQRRPTKTSKAGPSLGGHRQREKKRRVMLYLGAALDTQVTAMTPGNGPGYEKAQS